MKLTKVKHELQKALGDEHYTYKLDHLERTVAVYRRRFGYAYGLPLAVFYETPKGVEFYGVWYPTDAEQAVFAQVTKGVS